ncbi:MAG: hypothetical protein R3A79_12070 [Nannocystaceae bacterium]
MSFPPWPRRARAAATLVLAAAACLPEAVPSWLLTAPRLVVIEQSVVATGPLSPPLDADPPGVRRRDGLPGDRLRLAAFFAGPDGPVAPVDPPIWVRSRRTFVYHPGAEPIPPCADDGRDDLLDCVIAGDTLTLPPVPEGGFDGRNENLVFVFASTSTELSAADCLDFYLRGGEGERFDCHYGRERLAYGPYYVVEELAGEEVVAPEIEPDRFAEGLRFDLVFRGPAGERARLAARGDVVVMRPDETLTIGLVAAAEDFQVIDPAPSPDERREMLLATFFASAPVLPDSAAYEVYELGPIDAPSDDGAFIYAIVRESGRGSRSASLQWFYIQLVLGDPEAPP